MLDKFAERQKKQGAFSNKENPFEKFQFKDIVNTATALKDPAKVEAMFRKAELKLEEFFDQKKKYYKGIQHQQYFRTDEVAKQEKERDEAGEMSVRVKSIAQQQTPNLVRYDAEDLKIDMFHQLTQASQRMIPSLDQGANINRQAEAIRREALKKQQEAEFLKNYLTTMHSAIQRDLQNIDSYFPESLTNKQSPMFKDESTSLDADTFEPELDASVSLRPRPIWQPDKINFEVVDSSSHK